MYYNSEQKHPGYKKVAWPRKAAATKRECGQDYVITMHLR